MFDLVAIFSDPANFIALATLEGFGAKVSKGYIYTAMLFSAFIEALNVFCHDDRSAPGRKTSQACR
jgi:predicted tellurium resistance membrane protein TerC